MKNKLFGVICGIAVLLACDAHACKTKADCKGARVCNAGRCADPSLSDSETSCTSDVDCPGDLVCQSELCVTTPTNHLPAASSPAPAVTSTNSSVQTRGDKPEHDPYDVDILAAGLIINGHSNGYAGEIARIRYDSSFQLSILKLRMAMNVAKVCPGGGSDCYVTESKNSDGVYQENMGRGMIGVAGLGQFFRINDFSMVTWCIR